VEAAQPRELLPVNSAPDSCSLSLISTANNLPPVELKLALNYAPCEQQAGWLLVKKGLLKLRRKL